MSALDLKEINRRASELVAAFLDAQNLVIGRGYPIKSMTTIATKYGERVKVALKQGTIILPKRYLEPVKDALPEFVADKFTLIYEGFSGNYKVFKFGDVPPKKKRTNPLDSDNDEDDEEYPAIIGEPYIGGDSLARKALRQRGIPEASIPVFLASVSASTLKRYDAEWKKWWLFCQVNTLDVFDGRFDNILRFLTEEHDKKASYGTLKSLRSALAFLFAPQQKEDPSIKRFFKGIQNLDRPNNKPKCQTTWDPSLVWSRLESLQPNENLSLHLLTGKLATLMTLATGHRVRTLASIRTDDVEMKHDAVEIKIAKKASKKGAAFQTRLVLPFRADQKQLCVATTLIAYLNRTRVLRNKASSSLFMTSRKPHKNATSTCITRWIKEVMKASGCKEGIGLDTIRSTAGWTEKSLNFAKFYNRPV